MNKFFLVINSGFLFLILFCGMISCGSDQQEVRRMPDVSHIDVDLDLYRFDQALFAIDTNNVSDGLNQLYEKYPEFSELFFTRLTSFYHPNKDTFGLVVEDFLKDKNMRKLQDQINEDFTDLSSVKKDLTRALKFVKFYFPEYKTPAFYTLNSEFGFQSFIFEENQRDGVGIGLDLFLGKNFNYKSVDPKEPSFSNYLVRTYNEDHLVSKSMTVLIKDLLGDPPGKRFIDQMIYNGKELYLLEHLIPEAQDTVIVEQSMEQWEWLKNNEMEMWSYFLEKNLMYETNFFEINKYLNPAPHSPGMPPAAPGKTANFIGLQIVKSFMRRNPKMNLQDLIAFQDSQKLLEMSKYKPKRR